MTNQAELEQALLACTYAIVEINALQNQLQSKYQRLVGILHEATFGKQPPAKPPVKLVRIK